MRIRDFNAEAGQLYVHPSKNDKARHVTLTAEGIQFFEDACAEKNPDELIFKKENGEPGNILISRGHLKLH